MVRNLHGHDLLSSPNLDCCFLSRMLISDCFERWSNRLDFESGPVGAPDPVSVFIVAPWGYYCVSIKLLHHAHSPDSSTRDAFLSKQVSFSLLLVVIRHLIDLEGSVRRHYHCHSGYSTAALLLEYSFHRQHCRASSD